MVLLSIVNMACIGSVNTGSDMNYIAPAEINYRQYFSRNHSRLDPIEGIWTEYVVGTLYHNGKVLQRKEIPKRARWIVIKKEESYKILNEYGEQNKYVANFKQKSNENAFTFDCYFIKTKDHIRTEAKLVDGNRIEMAYDAPKGVFEENYHQFMDTELPEEEQKQLQLHWQFNWLKTFPLDLEDSQ